MREGGRQAGIRCTFFFFVTVFAFYQATQSNLFSLFQSSSQEDGKRSRRSGGSTTASPLTIGAVHYLAEEKITEREVENPGVGISNILDPIDSSRCQPLDKEKKEKKGSRMDAWRGGGWGGIKSGRRI